jgi:hypothetical protein
MALDKTVILVYNIGKIREVFEDSGVLIENYYKEVTYDRHGRCSLRAHGWPITDN